MNSKHAYLIMAHKYDYTFQTLLAMLDSEMNDIFIHMDIKNVAFKPSDVTELIKYSHVYFAERMDVTWGGYSLSKCEVNLLELATNTGTYSYYHLISGEDLPIKSQQFIHDFFDKNKGYEFIRFESERFYYSDRIRYFHFWQDKIGRNSDKYLLKFCEKCSINLQRVLGVNRQKKSKVIFQKGTNWFSITDDLARYIVSKSDWIKETFKKSVCSDELFVQTLVVNSEYVDRLYHSSFDNDLHSIMRLIDWDRGNPYIFKSEDYEMLMKSDMLWARKFNHEVDKSIIDRIHHEVG